MEGSGYAYLYVFAGPLVLHPVAKLKVCFCQSTVYQSVATFSITSLYNLIHDYIILCVFAYLFYVFVYLSDFFRINLIVNKRVAPQAPRLVVAPQAILQLRERSVPIVDLGGGGLKSVRRRRGRGGAG